jgi:hypothetical protein
MLSCSAGTYFCLNEGLRSDLRKAIKLQVLVVVPVLIDLSAPTASARFIGRTHFAVKLPIPVRSAAIARRQGGHTVGTHRCFSIVAPRGAQTAVASLGRAALRAEFVPFDTEIGAGLSAHIIIGDAAQLAECRRPCSARLIVRKEWGFRDILDFAVGELHLDTDLLDFCQVLLFREVWRIKDRDVPQTCNTASNTALQ